MASPDWQYDLDRLWSYRKHNKTDRYSQQCVYRLWIVESRGCHWKHLGGHQGKSQHVNNSMEIFHLWPSQLFSALSLPRQSYMAQDTVTCSFVRNFQKQEILERSAHWRHKFLRSPVRDLQPPLTRMLYYSVMTQAYSEKRNSEFSQQESSTTPITFATFPQG